MGEEEGNLASLLLWSLLGKEEEEDERTCKQYRATTAANFPARLGSCNFLLYRQNISLFLGIYRYWWRLSVTVPYTFITLGAASPLKWKTSYEARGSRNSIFYYNYYYDYYDYFRHAFKSEASHTRLRLGKGKKYNNFCFTVRLQLAHHTTGPSTFSNQITTDRLGEECISSKYLV